MFLCAQHGTQLATVALFPHLAHTTTSPLSSGRPPESPNCWTDFSILLVGKDEIPNRLLPKFQMVHISPHKPCRGMEEEFSRPLPSFLANAATVGHPVTQVNVTHMGCTVFDDLGFHSFPIFLEATSLLCTVLPTHSPYIPPTLNTVADVQG